MSSKNDDFTLSLLTREDVLKILRDSACGHPLRTLEDESVWIAPRKDGQGVYLALFNLSDKTRTVSLSAEAADLPCFRGTELWTGRKIRKTDSLRAHLAPHDAAVFLVK